MFILHVMTLVWFVGPSVLEMRHLLEKLCSLSNSTRAHRSLDLRVLDLVPVSGNFPDFQGVIDDLIVPCQEHLSCITRERLAWAFGERRKTLSTLATSVSRAESELFSLRHRLRGLQDQLTCHLAFSAGMLASGADYRASSHLADQTQSLKSEIKGMEGLVDTAFSTLRDYSYDYEAARASVDDLVADEERHFTAACSLFTRIDGFLAQLRSRYPSL